MDESRIGQYSISVTTYPIMALIISFIILLDGSISEVLNKLTVRVISEDECKNSFGNIIHKTTMCAVGVEKGSGTCQV